MRAPDRKPSLAVIDELFRQPHRFEFFQAVRLLERWFASRPGAEENDLMARRLQFRNSMSMSFAPSEIEQFKPIRMGSAQPESPDGFRREGNGRLEVAGDPAQIERLEITPAFMSLLGAQGCLPIFYTELFQRREQRLRDDSARAFLDMFLHRSTAMFYQAWRKHRLGVRYETNRRNEFLPQVLALAGVGQRPLRDRLQAAQGGVSDELLAFVSGLLQQRTVSAASLQQLLSLYFRVPLQVTQFVGRWFVLPQAHQTRLGMGSAVLGTSALAGERVWQRDLRVGLQFGPLTLAHYRRFLPGSPAARALRELVSLMTGVGLEYQVRLQLRAADVRPIQLGAQHGARLGWESFLVSGPVAQDRADVGYDLHASA